MSTIPLKCRIEETTEQINPIICQLSISGPINHFWLGQLDNEWGNCKQEVLMGNGQLGLFSSRREQCVGPPIKSLTLLIVDWLNASPGTMHGGTVPADEALVLIPTTFRFSKRNELLSATV